MYVSIKEAEGQLLDLVRRAESGEEVLLTHEGLTIGKIAPLDAGTAAVKPSSTPEQRREVIRNIVARFPPMNDGGPDAAHSQDFLYDENGLPA